MIPSPRARLGGRGPLRFDFREHPKRRAAWRQPSELVAVNLLGLAIQGSYKVVRRVAVPETLQIRVDGSNRIDGHPTGSQVF